MLPMQGVFDLATVVELACATVGARCASLLVPANDSTGLSLAAAFGFDEKSLADAHASIKHRIAYMVADSRQPLLVNGPRPDLPLNHAARYQSTSFISVPVPLGDRCGVLSVADPTRAPRFDEAHLRMLLGLSDLVARSLNAYAITQHRDELQGALTHLQRQVAGTQEAERGRIARDLHDEVGQILTAAVLRLDLAARKLTPEHHLAIGALRQTRDALLDMANTLHGIVFMLYPRILSDLGLVPALRSLFAQVEDSSGLKVHFDIQGVRRSLSPTVELPAFRIVQEGITNTMKHAGPCEAWVTLIFHPSRLEIHVRDNGVGIRAEALSARPQPTLGLTGMSERVETLGGTLKIASHPGSGTTILAVLPLTKKDNE